MKKYILLYVLLNVVFFPSLKSMDSKELVLRSACMMGGATLGVAGIGTTFLVAITAQYLPIPLTSIPIALLLHKSHCTYIFPPSIKMRNILKGTCACFGHSLLYGTVSQNLKNIENTFLIPFLLATGVGMTLTGST